MIRKKQKVRGVHLSEFVYDGAIRKTIGWSVSASSDRMLHEIGHTVRSSTHISLQVIADDYRF